MIAAAFIHMFSVFLLKAYRPPRELTWMSGFILLALALGFGFSGYLLPWNKLAFFATKVGTEIAGVVPLVGHFIMRFLRGGNDVTGGTLTRFFGFHVAVLPAITTVILFVHLFLVQKQGMSIPIKYQRRDMSGLKFFPNFFMRDLIGWLFALALLLMLSALFPWELGEKADPFAPAPAGIKPEWFFIFMFQTQKYIPSKIFFIDGEVIGILGFGIGAFIWMVIPFLDRRAYRGIPSPEFSVIGWMVIFYIAAMTMIAYIS